MRKMIFRTAIFLSALSIGIGFSHVSNVFDFFAVEEVPVGVDIIVFDRGVPDAVVETDSFQIHSCVDEIKYKPDPKSPTIKRGVLNSLIICGELPVYPADAIEKNISGAVVLNVSADDTGRITKVTVKKGGKLFNAAAVRAAYQSRICPTLLGGKHMQITGILAYDFNPATGVSLPKKILDGKVADKSLIKQ